LKVRPAQRAPSPATIRKLLLQALLAAWEVAPRLQLIPELFLPSLSETFTVLSTHRWIYGEVMLVTLYEVACAMLIACGARDWRHHSGAVVIDRV
jgi:NitT/TauT family transport system permease protein